MQYEIKDGCGAGQRGVRLARRSFSSFAVDPGLLVADLRTVLLVCVTLESCA